MKHGFSKKFTVLFLALALVFAFTAAVFAQGGDAPAASQGTAPAASDGQQGESSDGGQDSSQDQQSNSQKTELFTIMGLIAMGAMYVGIRDKNRRG